uniref:Hedgehog/Intein (Hint) domain-containing protein n=1 Tax=viral metagenome TaxID=1070528 RepID=A0A6C0IMP7_9ZZZZ
MGSQTFNYIPPGVVDTSFIALPGYDYTFTVTGAGGGGGRLDGGNGGNGAIVKAVYSGLTEPVHLTIIIGQGGVCDNTQGGGGGLTQVFNTYPINTALLVNIVAGGGGGGAYNNNGLNGGIPTGPSASGINGGNGGNNIGGTAGYQPISPSQGGDGGSGNQNPIAKGNDPVNSGAGGGGSALINGQPTVGGGSSFGEPSFNGGGGNGDGGGGGGGYGGGGGGCFNATVGNGGVGGGGGSIAQGSFLKSVNYNNSIVNTFPGGGSLGGGGGLSRTGSPGQVIITWTVTPPASNICFPAGTPIQTDQGIFPIEQLDKTIHTIQQQPILHITKTVTLDKYLICFEKNSLSRNIPSRRTIMSKYHKIDVKGQMVPAERLLNYSREVKKVQYNGEVLYNVLLADYSLMNVNGLMCETLHPDNVIAKLYTQYTPEERNDIVLLMNEALEKKDIIKYKSVFSLIG